MKEVTERRRIHKVITSRANNIQRCHSLLNIVELLLLMMKLLWWKHNVLWGTKSPTTTTTTHSTVHEAEVSTRRSWTRVSVLAFVGGDYGGGVLRGTLHPLLHAATACGATVVAPVCAHLRDPQEKYILLINNCNYQAREKERDNERKLSVIEYWYLG